jgi:hypothetical protein
MAFKFVPLHLLIVSLGMRSAGTVTIRGFGGGSSTEEAPGASFAPRHIAIFGAADYSQRLFVNGYHSKVEFSFSRTHGHHARNKCGQVPQGHRWG